MDPRDILKQACELMEEPLGTKLFDRVVFQSSTEQTGIEQSFEGSGAVISYALGTEITDNASVFKFQFSISVGIYFDKSYTHDQMIRLCKGIIQNVLVLSDTSMRPASWLIGDNFYGGRGDKYNYHSMGFTFYDEVNIYSLTETTVDGRNVQ